MAWDICGKVAAVTGGGSGLGAALCRRLAADGARLVVIDRDAPRADRVAQAVGGLGLSADVTDEGQLVAALEQATAWGGPIDIMVSNAGIAGPTDVFSSDDAWASEWQVHVMSNVYAARAVLPAMLERGSGWLISTASAVGLTNQPGTAAYVVTKHAQLALAEHLALTYSDRGIKVSCICPLGMRTEMASAIAESSNPADRFGASTLISPDEAASRAVDQISEDRFLVLTHPEVATYAQRRASDHDRWLAGMRRLYAQLTP